MSVKTTKKEILKAYPRVIEIGFLGAQCLLKGQRCYYYTAGTYGRTADIYVVKDTAICTGHGPFGTINYDLTQPIFSKAEVSAQKIWEKKGWDYEKAEKKISRILEKAIEKTKKFPVKK